MNMPVYMAHSLLPIVHRGEYARGNYYSEREQLVHCHCVYSHPKLDTIRDYRMDRSLRFAENIY